MNSYVHHLFWFLFFLCAGCQHQAASFLWPRSDYTAMTERWTRHHVFYDGLEHATDVYILAQSWQWRQCALQKEAKDYALPVSEYQSRQKVARQEHARGLDCIIAFAGETAEGLQVPQAFWKLYLCVDGQQIEPLEIRKLKWSAARLRSALYFWTPWQEVYRVRFPVLPQGGRSVLLASPLGCATFVWEDFQ